MAQDVYFRGVRYQSTPAVELPLYGGGYGLFADPSVTTAVASDVASGKKFLLADGSEGTGTASGGGMNFQITTDVGQRKANSYGTTGLSLKVAVSGTYTISWVAWRSSSSGTMGTNLHINSTSGTNHTTFTGTYGQYIRLENQSLQKNDTVTLYATSGSSNRTLYCANLCIEQTA